MGQASSGAATYKEILNILCIDELSIGLQVISWNLFGSSERVIKLRLFWSWGPCPSTGVKRFPIPQMKYPVSGFKVMKVAGHNTRNNFQPIRDKC